VDSGKCRNRLSASRMLAPIGWTYCYLPDML